MSFPERYPIPDGRIQEHLDDASRSYSRARRAIGQARQLREAGAHVEAEAAIRAAYLMRMSARHERRCAAASAENNRLCRIGSSPREKKIDRIRAILGRTLSPLEQGLLERLVGAD